MARSICAVIFTIVGILLGTTTASAFKMRVSFCNKMPNVVDVAVGYDLTGTDETRSEGWFTVQPCACATLFNEDVRTTDYWVYVIKRGAGIMGTLTNGQGPLC